MIGRPKKPSKDATSDIAPQLSELAWSAFCTMAVRARITIVMTTATAAAGFQYRSTNSWSSDFSACGTSVTSEGRL